MIDLWFKEPAVGDKIVSKKSPKVGILNIISVEHDVNNVMIVVAMSGKTAYRFIIDTDAPCARQEEFWYAKEYLDVLSFELNMQQYQLSKKRREVEKFRKVLESE